MKTCTKCDQTKGLEFFSKQLKGKFGVTSICKPCTTKRGKLWAENNPERRAANARAYNEINKVAGASYRKAWRLANLDRSKIVAAKWTAKNMDKKRAATARRRAARIQAIPSWANFDDIAKFYTLAKSLTAQTGIKATVDHLVPLKSSLVCGLHCAANLSIMTEKHNKSKGNFWWPQMWSKDEELHS